MLDDEDAGAEEAIELEVWEEVLPADEVLLTEELLFTDDGEDDAAEDADLAELLLDTLPTDDETELAIEDVDDEAQPEPSSTGAAAVCTNTDLIADQLPDASQALTPYR